MAAINLLDLFAQITYNTDTGTVIVSKPELALKVLDVWKSLSGIVPTLAIVDPTKSPFLVGSYTYYIVNAGTGSVILNLPLAINRAGVEYIFLRKDPTLNTVTISPTSPNTINQAGSYSLNGINKYVRLLSHGGNQWFVVGGN